MSRRRTRWTAAALAMVTLLAAGYGLDVLVNSRSFQLVGTLISHTDPGRQRVALTLDDGPSERTAEVLRVLDQAGVPATFYLIGRELAARPDDGRRIAAAGHEIGNHTYTHRRMVFVSSDTVRDEVERTDELIRATGYPGPITFRPPYGKKLVALPTYLADHRRITVMWDVEPDSGTPAGRDEIVRETVASARPGSIIVLHVMYQSGGESLAAIPEIVRRLRAAGYEFTTVSRLIGA